jgi:outer membrane beta-barrel protein
MNMPAIRIFLLMSLLVPFMASAENPVSKEPGEQVIQPQIDRRTVTVPKISARDIEFGVFAGMLNIESFGSNPVYGGRLAYHVTEDIFLEGTYAQSTVSDAAFQTNGIKIFSTTSPSVQSVDLTYYNLSVGVNLFPGELFIGRGRAMTSAVYLVGGIGNTSFDRIDNITYNIGIGIRIVPRDWLSLRIEMRDYLFASDLLANENKMTNNIELTFGLSGLF